MKEKMVKIHAQNVFGPVVDGLAVPYIWGVGSKNIKNGTCLTAQPGFDAYPPDSVIEIPLKWIGFTKRISISGHTLRKEKAGYHLALAIVYGEDCPRLAEAFTGNAYINYLGIRGLGDDYKAAWLGDPKWRYGHFWANWPKGWMEATRRNHPAAQAYSRTMWYDFLRGVTNFYDALTYNTKAYKKAELARAERLPG